MIPDEKLDKVLSHLDNDNEFPEDVDDIRPKLDFDISAKDLYAILEKLHKDGYADFKFGKTGGVPNNNKYYYITFHGRLFRLQKGYQRQTRDTKIKTIWTNIKITMAVINAVIILSIAAGVYVAWDAKQLI